MSLSESRLWSISSIHSCHLTDSEDINFHIFETFQKLNEEDFSERTHYFAGRFENLYVRRERIPALQTVLQKAESCAHLIIGPDRPLRYGFWLNAQVPGAATSEHTHDENDELLSCVYYVNVPPRSGDLLLYDGPMELRLRPESGQYLFFPPSLPHRVETNHSQSLRLSIAFNFGPADVRATEKIN